MEHPIRRFLSTMLLGAIVAWGLWTATAFPLVTNISMIDLSERVVSSPPSLLHLLILSTPLSTVSFGELWFHSWVLPVVLVYFVPAFLWGKSARRWWLPGLAYGLGAVITNPLPYYGLAFTYYSETFEYHTAAVMVLLVLPLTVAVAGLGALWQHTRGQIMSKEQLILAGQALPAFPGQPSTAVLLFRRPVSLKWLALMIIILAILGLEVFFYWRLWAVG